MLFLSHKIKVPPGEKNQFFSIWKLVGNLKLFVFCFVFYDKWFPFFKPTVVKSGISSPSFWSMASVIFFSFWKPAGWFKVTEICLVDSFKRFRDSLLWRQDTFGQRACMFSGWFLGRNLLQRQWCVFSVLLVLFCTFMEFGSTISKTNSEYFGTFDLYFIRALRVWYDPWWFYHRLDRYHSIDRFRHRRAFWWFTNVWSGKSLFFPG